MIRVLVAGLGNMGLSHALAHHYNLAARIVGLVNRSAVDLPEALQDYPIYRSFEEGLETEPDLVVIADAPKPHVAAVDPLDVLPALGFHGAKHRGCTAHV